MDCLLHKTLASRWEYLLTAERLNLTKTDLLPLLPQDFDNFEDCWGTKQEEFCKDEASALQILLQILIVIPRFIGKKTIELILCG